jgi:putative copper resistance protein D
MAAFADVLLRGLALTGQAVAIGGVFFAWLVLRVSRAGAGDADVAPARRVWLLISIGAATVGLAQVLLLGVLVGSLAADASGTFGPLAATMYVKASVVRIVVSALLAVGALCVRRRGQPGGWWPVVVGSALVLAASAAWTSHAAARLDHRVALFALDALHQLAAAVWIGGLLHLIAVALPSGGGSQWPVALLRRFSTLALAAVSLLIAAGVGLAVAYIDGIGGLLGTAYGVMVLTKVVVLGGLLVLGAMNFFVVRRLPDTPIVSSVRLKRFVEVEFGLGITVLFAAASLTSLPPAVDVVADRATLAEVATRFTPRLPALTSPPIEALPVDDPDAPRTDADRAWSEYNHHVSGMFVLLMGLLAIAYERGARWARHWPLTLLGLAAFMLVRNDPGSWPLGPEGFWEGMTVATVVQHRVFVLLVVGFGIFEWMVRTGRLRSPRAALVFPVLCLVGGGLLLTHSHASLNLKSEFLLEVTHAPLGVLGIVIGWGRWLELRLAAPGDHLPGRVWASALTLFGVLLLLYRES